MIGRVRETPRARSRLLWIRRVFAGNWTLGLRVYNITNKRANAAEYRFVDRLAGA